MSSTLRVSGRVRAKWATIFDGTKYADVDDVIQGAEVLDDSRELRKVMRAASSADRYLYHEKLRSVFVVAAGTVVASFEASDVQAAFVDDLLWEDVDDDS